MSTLVPLSHSPVKMFSFLFLHRVKEKIRELAKSPSLSATYIKNEVHKFSHTLVDHLNIGQDSTQFFPNEPAIKKIMRQFREALRLDPHDHIACSMYIEQDEAANPGPWLMQVMPLNTSKPQSVFFVFLVPQPRTSLFLQRTSGFTVKEMAQIAQMAQMAKMAKMAQMAQMAMFQCCSCTRLLFSRK